MYRNRKNTAVAEILSSVLLLAIAVSVFSVLYINVISDDGPVPGSYSTIIGRVEETTGETIFEHRRGEGISLDSKVSLLLEGIYPVETTVGDLLDSSGKDNDMWDIGEQLVYKPDPNLFPLIFLDDIQIRGIISDIEINSIIFWGILQEGYTVPPEGRGGIWHLDEGRGYIAHDSTLNENHGVILGSSWIGGMNNTTALAFTGEPTDYVVVPNSEGLRITEEITVEAWMKSIDASSGIIDKYNFDRKAADIAWIHIAGDIFAFGFWHPGDAAQPKENCRIQTLNLSPSGIIGDTAIDSIDFISNESTNGFDPDFIHIADSVYAVAHRFPKDNGYVTTFEIYDNGIIANDIIDRFEFEPEPGDVFSPDIIHVSGNIYAIASCDEKINGSGNIVTLEIAADGIINKTVIDKFQFESYNCSSPRIKKISDKTFIVAYASSDNGYVKTIEIENNGSINKTLIDVFEFESNQCFETDLEYIAPNVYTIAYRGPIDNGYVTTVEVMNNGNITKNTIDILKFDPSVYGAQPDIQRVTESNYSYAIAYNGPGYHGYLTTIEIFDNGTISDNVIDTIQFTGDSNSEMNPTIVHNAGNVYGIAYKGKRGWGYLISLSINNTGEIGGSEGRGGIFKDHSYALIINSTLAFATINNITINATGVIFNEWNHVALTYDGSIIKLYINNYLNSINISYPYNKEINFTENDDLYFGYLFHGCLDEIAIYDRALSEAEIKYHYNNPGDLFLKN
jgi:hypothetical protein